MIIEFSCANFRSFRDQVTFSMVAANLVSRRSELDTNNVFRIGANPDLLTTAAIFGANAGGKSNLILAFRFMRHFVLHSTAETRAKGAISVDPFGLSSETINAPSFFEVAFIIGETRYRYGFEVTQERVTHEWLFMVPSTREALLFEREHNTIKLGERFRKEGQDLIDKTRPNALYLSVVAQFNGVIAQTVVNWFRSCGVASGNQDWGMRSYTQQRLRDGEDAAPIIEFIKRLDLGIVDIRVESNPAMVPEFSEHMPEDIQRARSSLTESEDAERLGIKTVHTLYDGDGHPIATVEFDLDDHESDGTRKLFAFAGPIVRALSEGRVLIVDELDSRLHPLLTREIIKLFNNSDTNPHHAQLIFTTQDTNLLDNDLFRRDQIWFIEKDSLGGSQLYSLAEFRIRNDKSFERGYIQGRFGAIPYAGRLNELVEEYNAKAQPH